MTTHQELEHLEDTAVIMGDIMNVTEDLPTNQTTFDKQHQELKDFIAKSNEKKLEFILTEYDRTRPVLNTDDYRPLFGHYIQAIFKMKDELYNLKAVNRAYITKPQDGASTFIGEYEIRGTSFHMKDHSIKKAHLVCTRFRPHT